MRYLNLVGNQWPSKIMYQRNLLGTFGIGASRFQVDGRRINKDYLYVIVISGDIGFV